MGNIQTQIDWYKRRRRDAEQRRRIKRDFGDEMPTATIGIFIRDLESMFLKIKNEPEDIPLHIQNLWFRLLLAKPKKTNFLFYPCCDDGGYWLGWEEGFEDSCDVCEGCRTINLIDDLVWWVPKDDTVDVKKMLREKGKIFFSKQDYALWQTFYDYVNETETTPTSEFLK
jgi:hypothetical protein